MTAPPEHLAAALADRYRLEREVGAGGMATVYLAHDLRHGRSVAIKVFRPELAQTLGSERFLREIQIAAQLQHPHILPLHDSGEAAGCLYFLMPFVEGETLRAKLRREGPLPIDTALHITREVADALGYAHRRGVIHRDIKPENILLSEGHAFVADFGIARAIDSASQALTQTGFALGTPAYMAPEQAVGEKEVDGRADLYALGCVLYEMLTGAPPYVGATQQAVLVKRFTEPVPLLRAARPEAPEWLERLVLQTLDTQPHGRPVDAAAFLATLSGGLAIPAERPAAAPAGLTPSIAVLPFANMSADPDNEYFSDGISEELITALTRFPNLKVIARTSAFAFKGRNVDVREIGRTLGVRHVLEGSVRKAGTQLRIAAQLIDTVDGSHLWSERFDRRLEDVFAIQDEITEAIRASVGLHLLGRAHKARETDPETYAIFLRGMYAVGRQALRSNEAVDLLQQAIARDPSYAPAYTLLAYACIGQIAYALQNREMALSIGVAAAEEAVELDPDSPDAHAALHRIRAMASNTWAEDGYHLQRARELGSTRVHEQMMFLLARRGKFDEAVEHARQSIACDPINPAFLDQAALLFAVARRYDDAKATAREALSLDPSYWIASRWLGWVHLYSGDAPEAERVLRVAVEQSGRNVWPLSALAAALAVGGNRAEARTIANELGERRRGGEPILAFSMVLATMLLDRDEAYGWAEVAVRDKDFWIPMFGSDPEFDPMHDDARFVALSRRIGNPELPRDVRRNRWWDPQKSVTTPDAAPSIAVLPFANMSADPDNEYFSDGISEELTAALTRFPNLKVIARTSAFAFKGRNVDVREIGRTLGVRHVLEGSVRRAGTQLRIAAQLIDANDGSHLWSERYDRQLDDVFTIQDEITEAIRVAVGGTLFGPRPLGTTQTDQETYDLYLRGRALLHVSSARYAEAQALLEQACASDPKFVPALVCLGEAHFFRIAWMLVPARGGWAKVRTLAEQVTQLDPRAAAAERLHAMVDAGAVHDFVKAEQRLRRALADNPNDGLAHAMLAWYLLAQGRLDEAIPHNRRSLALDPLSPVSHVIASNFWSMTGFDEEAMRVATAAVELAPQYPEGYHMRGLAHLYAGRFREAIEDLVRVPSLGNPSAWPLAKRCIALAAIGQLEEVQQILRQVLARSDTEFMTPDAIACIYTHLGDHDEAFRWLDRAATEQAFWLSYLGIEPIFAPLRRDARFEPFCRKWGIPVQPLPRTALDAWTPPVKVTPAPKATVSLVVLPFANTSPDSDTDYFADGLTEEVIADLSNVRALKVIARNSAMRLKGTDKDVPTIGRELNVTHVLAGSVRRAGNQLRITAQLAEAAGDKQVWAGKFSGTIEDVFDLQERLAREIVASLKLALTPEEHSVLAERHVHSTLAYELLLRARQELYKTTKPSLDRAISYLEEAQQIEGPNLRIVSTLCIAYSWYLVMGWETTFDPLERVRAFADEARSIAPDSAESELGKAILHFLADRIDIAIRTLRRVIASRPGDTDALSVFGMAATNAGQPDLMRWAARRLEAVDPLSYPTHVSVGLVDLMSGDFPEAVRRFERGLQFDPENFDLRVYHAWTLALAGDRDAAATEYDKLAQESEGWSAGTSDWCRVSAAGMRGDAAAVQTAMTPALRTFLAASNPLWMVPTGEAFAVAGLLDDAVAWITRHFERNCVVYPHLVQSPLYEPLRQHPRFERFLPEARRRWEEMASRIGTLAPF